MVLGLLLSLGHATCSFGDEPNYTRQEDVIYGRKFGTALTMDVFTPKEKANGAAVVFVVSGGWFSAHESINAPFIQPFLDHGYTVFAVVHGSQPKFTLPEIIADMHRAVRYIRHRAGAFKIDPNRIGISGASAGGHLSLMQGTAGTEGDPKAKDPVDRESSRVQAVACFFPPTDFLNYGKPGENAFGRGILANYRAPFDIQEFNNQKKEFVPITDEARLTEIAKQVSPVYHVTADDPPTLIIHGDADKLVPIQQAQLVMDKLEELKIPHELVVRPGVEHGWKDWQKETTVLADWFDKYLKPAT
jgi:acetyl esterase/lipase